MHSWSFVLYVVFCLTGKSPADLVVCITSWERKSYSYIKILGLSEIQQATCAFYSRTKFGQRAMNFSAYTEAKSRAFVTMLIVCTILVSSRFLPSSLTASLSLPLCLPLNVALLKIDLKNGFQNSHYGSETCPVTRWRPEKGDIARR